MEVSDSLKYPIGRYQAPAVISEAMRRTWIEQIAVLPATLSAVVQGMSEEELETAYRPGGWTVRQVVHHVADSHINSYTRFRLALTEDVPVIKAYEEKLWAELPDARTMPVSVSLDLLSALHKRWAMLLGKMTEADFKLRLRHPVSGEMTLDWMVGLYAWHGRHHTAHILLVRP